MLFACGLTLFISCAAYAASISSEDADFGQLLFLPPITKNSCSSSKSYSDACAGRWWIEDVQVGKSGVHSMFWTFGGTAPPPSVSFQFSGSNVTIRGLRHAAGAKAIVVVDGVSHPINTMSVDGNRHPQRVLYSQTLLDPRVNHTLELHYNPATYNGTAPPTAESTLRFLAIDSFHVDSPDTGDDTGDDVSPDTNRTVVIVIAALGAVVGAVLALALASAWLRRWRARQRSRGDAYANIENSPPNVVVPFILPTKAEPCAQHAERARTSIVSAPPPYSGIPREATHATLLPLPRGSSVSTVTTSRASVIDSKES